MRSLVYGLVLNMESILNSIIFSLLWNFKTSPFLYGTHWPANFAGKLPHGNVQEEKIIANNDKIRNNLGVFIIDNVLFTPAIHIKYLQEYSLVLNLSWSSYWEYLQEPEGHGMVRKLLNSLLLKSFQFLKIQNQGKVL